MEPPYEKPPLGPVPELPPHGWLLPAAQPHEAGGWHPTFEFSFDTRQPFLYPALRRALSG